MRRTSPALSTTDLERLDAGENSRYSLGPLAGTVAKLVRQGTANPSFPGSNPGGASTLLVLLNLVDLLCDEAVRFAVDRVRRFGAGRLAQAEDLARLRIVPVLEISDAVLLLRLEVLLVRAGNV